MSVEAGYQVEELEPLLIGEQEKRSLRDALAVLTTEPLVTLQETPAQLTSGMIYDSETKYVRWERFTVDAPQLELLQLTDVQYGTIACKEERLVEYRDWVLAEPNRFMLWTGDMVNANTVLSKGSPFSEIGPPQVQFERFVRLMAPAAHRVLGYVGGNHERRAIPSFGDLGLLIARTLRIPYSGGKQHIDIYFGEHQPFRITLWHGAGGARTKGTVAQILHRLMVEGDSQLYLMGHVHQPLVMPMWKEFRNPLTMRMELRKVIGAVGSSFLDGYGSGNYAEIAGYASGDVMMARTVLEKTGKWEVTLR